MKQQSSVPIKLSVRITIAFSLSLALLLVIFTMIILQMVRSEKKQDIESSSEKIIQWVKSDGPEQVNPGYLQLPYYLSFIVYQAETENVYSTNDRFQPILPETDGKTKHYLERDYFIDANLDVFYQTVRVDDYVIQCSIDMENDSSSRLLWSMAKTLPLILIPVLVLSFFLALKLTNREFNREHDFTANVSHELQTPVNAIMGHAKLLNRWGKDDPEQLEKSLNVITKEAVSMKAIITNLLQMSKHEKGMIQIQKEVLDVKTFFNRLKEEYSVNKDLEIQFDPEVQGSVFTDSELLHELFTISISNSLKFCQPPCRIMFTFTRSPGMVTFQLKDNGKGFSKEILPHVFDRFYRGDASHSRSKGGAGLGLSIAQSIAASVNAHISARNAPEGGAIIQIDIKQ